LLYVYLGSAAKNLAEVAGGNAGQRSMAEWVFFGAGLLATLVVTVVVTRIARRAMSTATANSQRPVPDARRTLRESVSAGTPGKFNAGPTPPSLHGTIPE